MQDINFNEFWGFAYAWADLTVGAHACPSLKRSDAAEFVESLREIVKEEDEAISRKAIKITGFPPVRARPGRLSALRAFHSK